MSPKSISIIILLILVTLISCSQKKNKTTAPNELVDDIGNVIKLDSVPAKVITLAPNLTEMIYYIGMEKHLVGNTLYCNYPPAAQKITKVGDMLSFNYEKILTIKPDLIFITVEGNTKETYDKFKELGLKVFVSNPRNYVGIRKTLLDFGKIFGIEKETEAIAAEWDSTITFIKNHTKSNQKKSAMYVVELRPIMLAGSNTFLNQYLEFCGLTNISEDSPMNYPVYSREEILKRDPNYIIYPTDGSYNKKTIESAYPEWKTLSAVKNNDVIFVDRDIYSRPGPRFVEAVKDLYSKILHLQKDRH